MRENIEKRAVGVMDAPADSNTLTGYVVVYDSPTMVPIPKSEHRPGKPKQYKETIRKGAFSKVGQADQFDAFAMSEHDIARPLGRRSNGTLRLSDEAKGVKAEIDLPETSYAADVKSLVKRGDIRGMSVGMLVKEQKWDFSDPMLPSREIIEAEIYDVTVCALPIYADATVALRSMQAAEAPADKSLDEAAAKEKRNRQLQLLRLRQV